MESRDLDIIGFLSSEHEENVFVFIFVSDLVRSSRQHAELMINW